MSSHANYAKIGFTVVIGIVAIVAVLIYLGGAGHSDITYAETYYDTSVSGLSVGSAVNFRGVKIGEVKEISFVGAVYDGVPWADAQRIYILMAFPNHKMGPSSPERAEEFVAKGLRATVTASGVTGLSRIELDIQRDRPPAPKVPWKPRNTYIPSYPSLLDNFSDSATKVMNEINRMDIASVWSNVSAAVDSAAHAAEGIRTVVDAARSSVDSVVGSVAEAAESLRDVTMELKRNPSLLIREREAAPLEETN
ncbi:MAG: MCE family protein [Kiritimatiellae bacterium]|nr:MCE family protein [Kiritimatiellia bacterium]